MKEFQLKYQETKEEFEESQMQEWLADSHCWIEKNGTFVCKWCGAITTTTLVGDAHLCKENPKIKIIKNKWKE